MKMTEKYKLRFSAFPIYRSSKSIRIKHNGNGKFGVFVIHTCKFIKPKYDWVWGFSEGRSEVWLNGKIGYIDINGNEVIPLKYDNAGYFSEGRAMVRLNGKKGYVDKDGNETWDENL